MDFSPDEITLIEQLFGDGLHGLLAFDHLEAQQGSEDFSLDWEEGRPLGTVWTPHHITSDPDYLSKVALLFGRWINEKAYGNVDCLYIFDWHALLLKQEIPETLPVILFPSSTYEGGDISGKRVGIVTAYTLGDRDRKSVV